MTIPMLRSLRRALAQPVSGRALASAAIGAALVLSATATVKPAAAEETLRVVSPWPKGFFITQSLLRFIDKVNKQGKGVVQLQFAGGPEAIPSTQQPGALRRGAIDMYYGSAAYLLGSLPEVDAVAASNLPPEKLRADGAYTLLDGILQKKINAKFLAQVDSGWNFFILLSKKPKLDQNGALDLSGLRLRSHPLYNEFLSSLGATNVVVPTTEIYTAFERGIIDGLAFSEIGMRDFKLDKFVKYRVYPAFYQGDIVLLANLDRWNKLSDKAKKTLTEVALQHEKDSREHFLKEVKAEREKLKELGIEAITLTGKGAEEYLKKANAVPWGRMKKAGSENVEALRAKFRK